MRGRHTIWTDIFCLGDELDVVDGKGAPFVWRGFSSGATAIVAGIVALALTPLPPAKRRTAGMALEGLLKATATRSVDASLEFGPSLKIEPQRLFRAIQELT